MHTDTGMPWLQHLLHLAWAVAEGSERCICKTALHSLCTLKKSKQYKKNWNAAFGGFFFYKSEETSIELAFSKSSFLFHLQGQIQNKQE